MMNNLDGLSDLVGMADGVEGVGNKMGIEWAKMFVEDHPGTDLEVIRKWFSIVRYIGYTAGVTEAKERGHETNQDVDG